MFIGEPSRLFQMVSIANMRIYFGMAKEKVYFCRKAGKMKKIIDFIKYYREQRLRERCVKYALKSCKGTEKSIGTEATLLYNFFKAESKNLTALM